MFDHLIPHLGLEVAGKRNTFWVPDILRVGAALGQRRALRTLPVIREGNVLGLDYLDWILVVVLNGDGERAEVRGQLGDGARPPRRPKASVPAREGVRDGLENLAARLDQPLALFGWDLFRARGLESPNRREDLFLKTTELWSDVVVECFCREGQFGALVGVYNISLGLPSPLLHPNSRR